MAEKINQIPDYDWLPERAKWAYLAGSGFPDISPSPPTFSSKNLILWIIIMQGRQNISEHTAINIIQLTQYLTFLPHNTSPTLGRRSRAKRQSEPKEILRRPTNEWSNVVKYYRIGYTTKVL